MLIKYTGPLALPVVLDNPFTIITAEPFEVSDAVAEGLLAGGNFAQVSEAPAPAPAVVEAPQAPVEAPIAPSVPAPTQEAVVPLAEPALAPAPSDQVAPPVAPATNSPQEA